MTDLLAQYLDLVFAKPTDPRLEVLLAQLTPEQVRQAQEMLIAAYVKVLPPLPPNAPTLPEASDFVGLYLEIVRRGARVADPRLAAMLSVMSRDELRRSQRAIGELWLEQLITGPPN
jgi:hypothetical protein